MTWVIAAIFTKFLAWYSTSEFLNIQVKRLSDSWVHIISEPNFIEISSHFESSQLLLGWRDNQLVLQQSPFFIPKPSKDDIYRLTVDDHKWVIQSQCQQLTNSCVIVGLRDTERKYAVRKIMAAIFLPLLFTFFIALLIMYFAVKSGLAPLNQLTKKLKGVSIDQLGDIPEGNANSEVLPLIKAINQLMHNMKSQLLKERQFLDTCTHELRTPVTALVAHAHNLQKQGETKDLKNHHENDALKKVTQSAERIARVASQFLGLAKNSNSSALDSEPESFDLCELSRQVISDILCTNPKFDCQMAGLETLPVLAHSLSMEMVIRNLIENAKQYGYSDNEVIARCCVTFESKGNQVILIVEDAGNGVESEYQKDLLKRFYRAPNANESKHIEGAGLGLSIVAEVAARYKGNVIFGASEELGGLKVTVTFLDIINRNKINSRNKRSFQYSRPGNLAMLK